MSYTLNRTDGTVLTDLIDGVLDTDTTDLALVGKNYTGYGEFINENFIKLLENFANPNSPTAPMRGQLWYDSSENKLKVFDGEQFQSAAGSFVTDDNPIGPVSGDTWFKTDDRQFYLWTGSEWVLIGPQYNTQQGTSGFIVDTIQDRNLNSKTVLKLFIGNTLQAVVSKEEFIPNDIPGNIINQLITDNNPTGTIFKGYNIIDKDNFVFTGKAESAQALISTTEEVVFLDQLLRSDINETMIGSLTISNDAGLTIGNSQGTILSIDNGFSILNNLEGENIRFRVNSSQSELSSIDAITILANEQSVGIFKSNPQFNLDVTGDARITGNLIVEGNTSYFDVGVIRVEDKNIELGVLSDSTEGDDDNADGGGIILRSVNGSKDIIWTKNTKSWNTNQNFNLSLGKEYRINNQPVLSSNRLYDSVSTATGLVEIGTLRYLAVDNIFIDNTSITTLNSTTLTLNAGGEINVSNSKISNLDSPTDPADAATKEYVDSTVNNVTQIEPIVFSLDVTGWTSPDIVNQQIILLLQELYPASPSLNNKEARIATFWYNPQNVNIDVASGTADPSYVSVLATIGGNVSVVQSIALPTDLTTTFQPEVQRQVRRYIVDNGQWIVN